MLLGESLSNSPWAGNMYLNGRMIKKVCDTPLPQSSWMDRETLNHYKYVIHSLDVLGLWYLVGRSVVR